MRGKSGLFSRYQPFSPTTFSGLTGWWDAADSATLFDATSGGSGVAADGEVARWEDKSGNGRHWTQATSSQRPARKTAVLNSLDVVRLDGSDDRMGASSWTFANLVTNDKWSAFAVAKASSVTSNSSTNGNQTIVFEAGSSNGAFFFRTTGVVGGLVYGQNLSFQQTTTAYTAGTWKQFSIIFDTAADFEIRVNGGSPGSIASPSPPQFAGDSPWLGFAPNGSLYFDGDIGEVIFYNVALSTGDREAVESYLQTKWAIT